jgi:hypothetical protein
MNVFFRQNLSQRKLYDVLFTTYHKGEQKRITQGHACIMHEGEDKFQSQNLK